MNFLFWVEYIITFLRILLLSIYTYIKFCLFGNKQRVPPLFNRDCKIAIIGGGISGVGAAYSLLNSGYRNVTIYEAHDKLGGNAKTHLWQDENITTGISVLAWPEIFHNYIYLLNKLNIETTIVQLPFFIHNKETNDIFAHGKEHQYKNELKRWNLMINLVRYVTKFLHGNEISLYNFSLLNPFNYISIRFLSLIFGISNHFWYYIVVPMYASSFLSTKLSFIPSSILPIIDNLISLQSDRIPTMQTWLQTSNNVFEQMTKDVIIQTNHQVKTIHIKRNKYNQIMISIDNNEKIIYDRIIFACNSNAIINALINGNTKISFLLKLLLSSITYGGDNDDDLNLLDGLIHRDINILPNEYANDLRINYANYIDVKYDRKTENFYYYNTFILSSWLPNVHAMLKENQIEHKTMEPMLITYGPNDQPAPKIDEKKIYGKVNNRRAHPNLSFRNQIISLLIRLVQGENGMYFCGNSVTPANGHDLSLISGFAVAELIGAKYPFDENASALKDYNRFKRMCVN